MNIHHGEMVKTISGILQVPPSFHDQIEGSIVPPLAHQHRTLHALRRAKVAGWVALGKVGFGGWQPWHPVGNALPQRDRAVCDGLCEYGKRFCLEVVRWIKETLINVIRELRGIIFGNFLGYERCKNRN